MRLECRDLRCGHVEITLVILEREEASPRGGRATAFTVLQELGRELSSEHKTNKSQVSMCDWTTTLSESRGSWPISPSPSMSPKGTDATSDEWKSVYTDT